MSFWGNRGFNPIDLKLDRIVCSTSVSYLKKHPCFDKAKKGECIDSAHRVVNDIVKKEALEEIKRSVSKNPLIIPVIDREGLSSNKLPIMYGLYIADQLQGEFVKNLVKTTKLANTNANLVQRVDNDIRFEGQFDMKDREIIIVDDTWTVGGTAMALVDHVLAQGGIVKAITTLACGRYSKRISPEPSQLESLAALLDLTVWELKNNYKHAIEQATGSEIQACILRGKGAGEMLKHAN